MVKRKALKAVDPLEINIGGFLFTETGVEVQGRPDFDAYESAYRFAQRAHKASGWWLADLLRIGEARHEWSERLSQIVDATGLSEKTLKNVRAVGAIEPSRRRDGVEFSIHAEVAAMEPDEQDHWLEETEKEGWTRGELRLHIRASKRRKVIEGQATLAGRYRFVYADFPFRYGDSGVISGSAYGRAEAHYDTMTIEEGMALPVGAHVMPVATLYLWVPAPLLYSEEGKPGPAELARAWGFPDYKSNFVWDKVLGMPGNYNHTNHEHLLIFTRGGDKPDVPTPQPKSVIRIRRGDEHSGKPHDIYRMIERHYTTGPYLELFAREKREGWSAFGNDAKLWSEQAVSA